MFGGGGVWWRAQWKQAFSVCGWFGVKQTFTWIIESQRTGEYWSIQVSSPLTCLCLSLSLAWGGRLSDRLMWFEVHTVGTKLSTEDPCRLNHEIQTRRFCSLSGAACIKMRRRNPPPPGRMNKHVHSDNLFNF